MADPAIVAELQRLAGIMERDSERTDRALGQVARELADLRRMTEGQGGRLEMLERRVGGVQEQLVGLARTDTETTSRVGDVQVELARLAARAGQHADRSEEASRRAEAALTRAARGKALRAILQAAGVLLATAIATTATRCTEAHGRPTERPLPQEQAGP